ncbi:MAG TPA: hypothetical protein DDX19_11355 [Rhodopirellula baltica]|nr:hypothetical protein [Rhodopirellula baltica]
MTNCIETKLRSTPTNKKNRRGKKNRRRERVLSMETLQSRGSMVANVWIGSAIHEWKVFGKMHSGSNVLTWPRMI